MLRFHARHSGRKSIRCSTVLKNESPMHSARSLHHLTMLRFHCPDLVCLHVLFSHGNEFLAFLTVFPFTGTSWSHRPVSGLQTHLVWVGHRVLQGAAQRGGAILLHLCRSPGRFFLCSKMSLFYLNTCTPVKGTLKIARACETAVVPRERVQFWVCLFLYCWYYPGVIQIWVCKFGWVWSSLNTLF